MTAPAATAAAPAAPAAPAVAAVAVVATVAGESVLVDEVDAREAALRASGLTGVLPVAGTSEGRQLRRWLTQLLVTERVIALEASARGIAGDDPEGADGPDGSAVADGSAPGEAEVLPDATARLEMGSVSSAVLTSSPRARALFALVTAGVDVAEAEIAAYHARNPYRFADSRRDAASTGWDVPLDEPPALARVRDAIAAQLRGAARRRAFAAWLDGRRAELVWLAPGYEHPGDPRQPDNTHKH